MKKTFVAIMLGITVFAVAGCNSDKSETEIGKPLVIERPQVTTTTTSTSALEAEVEECGDSLDGIIIGLESIQAAMDSLPSWSDEEVLDYLATAKEFVLTSIETVELCAYIAPEEAADFEYTLYELLDSINDLANVYETY